MPLNSEIYSSKLIDPKEGIVGMINLYLTYLSTDDSL